jgi:hypothetical protein
MSQGFYSPHAARLPLGSVGIFSLPVKENWHMTVKRVFLPGAQK